MGLFKVYLALLIAPLFAASELDEIKLHSLYLMQQDQVEESIERYREFSDLTGRHDFEILQQMGLILLQKGIQSENPQTFMMTLLGAGLSGSASAIEILERGISSPDPQVQLVTLHFIAKFDDDRANELFNRAMGSDFLGIRMEAAFYLAQRKHPHAVGQIEGLMYRLPPSFKAYFPSLFALLGTSDATHSLRRLIEDTDPQTRVESILNVARLGRDDFLPLLRKRLTHTHIAELEATAYAMGALKDSNSIPKLKKLTQSPTDTVRLAASLSLFHLGDRTYVPIIESLAKTSNLFAIASLGAISETEETLAELLASTDLQVRTNAAVALLQRRDPRCLPVLSEILIDDARDLAFHPFNSIGRTFSALKAVPSAELRAKDNTVDLSYSLAIREHLLRESIHLPPEHFLKLARSILNRQQHDLVPTLISLLESLQTDEAIAVLKVGSEKVSAPLIRDYCHLALFRLNQEGPHEEYVYHWVMNQKGADLIQMKQLLPWKYRLEQSDYTLTAEETSRLLIEAFMSIASRRDEKSISFLLEAIQLGNPQNRYALMGLLMKATE
ncbi:MAG TPA: HEAT repeat domain-containing protein [Chlamydiales bacterium]|nr:HEAT repeat domain-containing protein [Chlamydiales bacterium]